LLRHVGAGHATVWVEVDGPCEVEVLGATERTFEVEGHHFALVHVTGLPEEGATPYEVALDGERAWPPADWQWPASCVRTVRDDHGLRICFGSCRCAYPNEPPWTLTKDEHPEGRGHDALRALALRMADQDTDEWPHLLLLLGDQVYADEVAPATEEFIRARRDVEVPPGLQISDFQEYCRLYRDSWSEPSVRWLLSTVPTAMIFDDHDVIDDWNTSRDWVAQMRANGWWDERIVGAFASYWCYQHLGNLSPEDREQDPCYRAARAAEGDASAIVRDFAFRADREVAGARWSYKRDIGRTRIVVMDSRAGRVLEPGARSMVDADEWACIEEWTRGDFDHLLLGTSLPVFLGRGMHFLEAWNEAVSDGAWGRLASRAGERLRQGVDLEHWAAFGDSLRALERLLAAIASGRHGSAPGTVVLLSGDVHHAYIADARPTDGQAAWQSPVYQAVCSPLRNPLDGHERRAIKVGMTRPAERVGRTLARAAGVGEEPLTWEIADGPWFDNQVATLDLDGRRCTFRLESAVGGGEELPRLEHAAARRLA
jgi:PhoD-like phosphatase